ncbi:MAG: hypothetical protein VKJ04_01085 [Vampirovibrionales bacterium]|nr:hypothetical protein [Vampirovibrionales bacterium]
MSILPASPARFARQPYASAPPVTSGEKPTSLRVIQFKSSIETQPLKIAILTVGNDNYAGKNRDIRRLKDVAASRGHQVVVIPASQCQVLLSPSNGVSVLYQGKPIQVDGVIPRIDCGPELPAHKPALQVLRAFELQGIPTLDTADGIEAAHNKFTTMLKLQEYGGINYIPTGYATSEASVDRLLRQFKPNDLFVKLVSGSEGKLVFRAETKAEARKILNALYSGDFNAAREGLAKMAGFIQETLKQGVVIQPTLTESLGRDYRFVVVGDEVVAAVRRVAKPGEARSNKALGGTAESIPLSEINAKYSKHAAFAVQAVKALGLHSAGVDIMEMKNGLQSEPVISEINPNSPIELLEQDAKIPFADKYIRCLEKLVAAQKRLSVSA